MEDLIAKALERVEAHKGTIDEKLYTQVVDQLNWIRTNCKPNQINPELPDFNLGIICVRVFDDLDPHLSEIIRRILSKTGYYENKK